MSTSLSKNHSESRAATLANPWSHVSSRSGSSPSLLPLALSFHHIPIFLSLLRSSCPNPLHTLQVIPSVCPAHKPVEQLLACQCSFFVASSRPKRTLATFYPNLGSHARACTLCSLQRFPTPEIARGARTVSRIMQMRRRKLLHMSTKAVMIVRVHEATEATMWRRWIHPPGAAFPADEFVELCARAPCVLKPCQW